MHAYLTEQIAASAGWLSFERFMDMALYAPGLGYYSAGAHKLGEGGDFTTAPEVSALFGACVARQCAEILSALGKGQILEIGAGSGRLAADVLLRSRLSESYPIVIAFSRSVRTCANVSAATSHGTCRRACRSASTGSISRPSNHSTADPRQ